MRSDDATLACPRCRDAQRAQRLRVAAKAAGWSIWCVAGGMALWVFQTVTAIDPDDEAAFRRFTETMLIGDGLWCGLVALWMALDVAAWCYDRRAKRPVAVSPQRAASYRAPAARAPCALHPPRTPS